MFHRLSPSIGTTKSLSAISCKHIKQQLTTDCNAPSTSGLYWVKGMQVCAYMHDKYIYVTVSAKTVPIGTTIEIHFMA